MAILCVELSLELSISVRLVFTRLSVVRCAQFKEPQTLHAFCLRCALHEWHRTTIMMGNAIMIGRTGLLVVVRAKRQRREWTCKLAGERTSKLVSEWEKEPTRARFLHFGSGQRAAALLLLLLLLFLLPCLCEYN